MKIVLNTLTTVARRLRQIEFHVEQSIAPRRTGRIELVGTKSAIEPNRERFHVEQPAANRIEASRHNFDSSAVMFHVERFSMERPGERSGPLIEAHRSTWNNASRSF